MLPRSRWQPLNVMGLLLLVVLCSLLLVVGVGFGEIWDGVSWIANLLAPAKYSAVHYYTLLWPEVRLYTAWCVVVLVVAEIA